MLKKQNKTKQLLMGIWRFAFGEGNRKQRDGLLRRNSTLARAPPSAVWEGSV